MTYTYKLNDNGKCREFLEKMQAKKYTNRKYT